MSPAIRGPATASSVGLLRCCPRLESEAQRSIEGFGGRMLFFSYCFGEYDGIVITEFPNHEAAMASLLTLNAAGALTKTSTVPLISVEEGVRAMQKAHDTKTGYTPPG